jgi:hypothetical protein
MLTIRRKNNYLEPMCNDYALTPMYPHTAAEDGPNTLRIHPIDKIADAQQAQG